MSIGHNVVLNLQPPKLSSGYISARLGSQSLELRLRVNLYGLGLGAIDEICRYRGGAGGSNLTLGLEPRQS